MQPEITYSIHSSTFEFTQLLMLTIETLLKAFSVELNMSINLFAQTKNEKRKKKYFASFKLFVMNLTMDRFGLEQTVVNYGW